MQQSRGRKENSYTTCNEGEIGGTQAVVLIFHFYSIPQDLSTVQRACYCISRDELRACRLTDRSPTQIPPAPLYKQHLHKVSKWPVRSPY